MGIKATLKILFFIRKKRLLRNGEVPVYMRITIMGKIAEISLNRSIEPQYWCSKKAGAIGNTKKARILNLYIESIRMQLQKTMIDFHNQNLPINVTSLKNSFLGIEEDNGKKIIELMKEHNEDMEKLVGIDFSYETLKRHRTSLNHVQAFIKMEYNKDDLFITKLDYRFITKYELYFKTVRKCNHNTTMKYIKNLRKIINLAIAEDYIERDPFAKFKMTYKKVDRGYLTDEELNAIINLKFKMKRLEQVRDCFIFSCFTGLSHSDLKRLSKENIVTGTDGGKWIKIKRKKTDNLCSIPILSVSQQLLDKYKNNVDCVINNILLPVKSNQKMNAYLKEIADLCGITKNLSSHLARHTFATTVTLNNGVPIESVSKMLGHSSIRITTIYARLLDKKVGLDMQHLNDKFSLNSEE